nr:MFS transporter [Mesorhizobium sp. LSHC422A00]
MPLALYALAAGAFGIGVTEFVIMGLLIDVSKDLGVSISAAGQLISGYALGVVIGAPLLTIATGNWPRKTVLLALMAIFTLGNLACAIAPDYWTLMGARIITAFAHGTFFGVGSVVATGLVAPNKKASAIALMFTGLTIANILGVPFGTWLGQAFGWRATFWAVTLVGLAAFAVILLLVPRSKEAPEKTNLRADLASPRCSPRSAASGRPRCRRSCSSSAAVLSPAICLAARSPTAGWCQRCSAASWCWRWCWPQ